MEWKFSESLLSLLPVKQQSLGTRLLNAKLSWGSEQCQPSGPGTVHPFLAKSGSHYMITVIIGTNNYLFTVWDINLSHLCQIVKQIKTNHSCNSYFHLAYMYMSYKRIWLVVWQPFSMWYNYNMSTKLCFRN